MCFVTRFVVMGDIFIHKHLINCQNEFLTTYFLFDFVSFFKCKVYQNKYIEMQLYGFIW